MKKLFLLTAAFASMLFASCQKEEVAPTANETTVTYTVEIPDVQVKSADTKAIGDGFNVDELVYEVWKTEVADETDLMNPAKATRLYQKTAPMVRLGDQQRTTISLNLVQDQEYTILFWAQNAAADAYNTEVLTNVRYSANATAGDYISNREDMAAFYGVDYVSDGDPKAKTVYLKRPFAQLNLGTKNTATDYKVTVNTTEVFVENVPMAFNVATKTSSENVGKFWFSHGAVPGATNQNGADDAKIRVNDQVYEWAAMNYMFATNGGQTAKVTYAIATTLTSTNLDGSAGATTDALVTNVVENVPLKENFRTNIVGNLLTSTTDYNVIIDARWDDEGDGNIVEVWDGKNVQEPYFNASKNQYEISLATELAWLAAAVNGTLDITTATGHLDIPQTFKGKTFVLMEDIDLANYPWTPIGATGKFEGTFNGNGKTIKNLNVTVNGKTPAGLFSFVKDIKNLNVDGAVINAHYKAGVITGDGLCSRIENCHVTNANVIVTTLNKDDGNQVGGIVGYLSGESTAYVRGCSVTNSTIKGYRDVAGIAGTANQTAEVTGNTVANVTVIADQTAEYKENKAQNVGAVAGRIHANANVSGNTVGENVTVYTLVGSSAQLQNALNFVVAGENDIRFARNMYGNVTAEQTEGKNIIINGNGKKYNGTITIDGNSRFDGAETILFKNINFITTDDLNFIEQNSTDGAVRYPHNVTIEECTFEGGENAVATKFRQGYNIKFVNSEVKAGHSLAQLYGCTGVTVDGVKVEAGRGMSLGTSTNVTVKGSEFNVTSYGLRADGTVATTLKIENTSIDAEKPVIVRELKAAYNVEFTGNNTLTTNEAYQVVLTGGADDAEYTTPNTKEFKLKGAENFKVYFGDVNSAHTLDLALNTKCEGDIDVKEAIDHEGYGFEVRRDVVLDFNNFVLNAGSNANSRWYALEISGDNDVVIKNANFTRAGITASNGANVVFENGTINHNPERTSRYIFNAQSGATIIVKEGTFKNDRAKNSFFWADNATIIIEGGNFGGVASNNKVYLSNGGQVIIKGGTFNFDPTAYLAEDYQAVKSGNVWTVSAIYSE